MTLLTEIGLLVVWGFGIWQISKGEITVGVKDRLPRLHISRFTPGSDSDEPHRFR